MCCILATFYFLLVWREEANPMYLAPAGLLAGFCYAIKINALLIPALALLLSSSNAGVILSWRWRAAVC